MMLDRAVNKSRTDSTPSMDRPGKGNTGMQRTHNTISMLTLRLYLEIPGDIRRCDSMYAGTQYSWGRARQMSHRDVPQAKCVHSA